MTSMGLMRLFTYVSMSYLSRIQTGYSISENYWQIRKLLRHSNVRIGITFPCGPKSTVKFTGLVCQSSRRYVHNEPKFFSVTYEKTPNFNLFKTLTTYKNVFYINFALDKNFTRNGLIKGAEQALTYVTRNLKDQNESALKEVVTPECLKSLLETVDALNEEQKTIFLVKESAALQKSNVVVDIHYPKKGPDHLHLVVDALFYRTEMDFNSSAVKRGILKFKFYCLALRRLYGKEYKSHWIVNNFNFDYCEFN